MLEQWINQMTGLSFWQAWLLIGLCIFLVAMVATIDRMEDGNDA